RRRHTRSTRDWSSDVCSSDLAESGLLPTEADSVDPAKLAAATAAAQQTDAAADEAEHEARSLSERIEILQKNIDLARQLRETARSEERRVGKEWRGGWHGGAG